MALTYGFALNEHDNSAQFSGAFHALMGDGICEYGGKFELKLEGEFTFTLATGFALVNGRYIKSDEPYELTLSPSGNYSDRYDAVAARVDYEARKGGIEVLSNIDPGNPALLRNAKEYSAVLYIIHVKRGATVLHEADIRDARSDPSFCGYAMRMDSISNDVLNVYRFFKSGIDEEAARLIGLSNDIIARANKEIERIDSAIQAKGKTSIGDVELSMVPPAPENEWLLCNGDSVPEEYSKLREAIGENLPNIVTPDARLKSYIYGGAPDILVDYTEPLLKVRPYTGKSEISVIVNGVTYDAENISFNADSAPNGTLIINKI